MWRHWGKARRTLLEGMAKMSEGWDALVVGGGASGLMAAWTLARRGCRTVLLEKQDRVGRKLLSTGNGRCNLTNLGAKVEQYHGSRRAVRAALRAWPPKKVVAVFGEMGIPCIQEEDGRVYPRSQQAASVLDALRLGCGEIGAELLTGFRVADLRAMDGGFRAEAEDGRRVFGRCALVCTGGLAAPRLGACGDGHRLLKALGHSVNPCRPALSPLRMPAEAVRGLKGIRAEAELTLRRGNRPLRTEQGEVLFAEYGVSGIAAMQLARQAQQVLQAGIPCALKLNLAPGLDAGQLIRDLARHLPARRAEDLLNGTVPRRLGQVLAKSAGLSLATPAGALSGEALAALAGALEGWTLPVTGVQGYEQAQVTAGGVSLEGFDPARLSSLRVPGLFAAGEVLDVDGDCGGYNLQWAWSSALTAADAMEAYLKER